MIDEPILLSIIFIDCEIIYYYNQQRVDWMTQLSTFNAIVNLSKICIGAGILALPFTISKAGLLFAPCVIGIVAIWNALSCTMIIRCKEYCDRKKLIFPDEISSSYSKIAYAGLGWFGVYLTDFSVIVTLLGVCIAYQITFSSLMTQIAGIKVSYNFLAIVSACIVYPICCVRSIAALSASSFLGLVCLIGSILAILSYGIFTYGAIAANNIIHEFERGKINDGNSDNSLPSWPRSFIGMTSFIGVAVFCFGLCSMVFPVQESMKYKHQFNFAVVISLLLVWFLYILVGNGAALLYINSDHGISDNILGNLPNDATASTLVKLSMAGVCLLTYPLTMMVPGQIVENIIRAVYRRCFTNIRERTDTSLDHIMHTQNHYNPVPTSEDSNSMNHYQSINELDDPREKKPSVDVNDWTEFICRCLTRLLLVILCTMVTTLLPCFALIISLLGSCTVTILSFVLPPVLHSRIITGPQYLQYIKSQSNESEFLLEKNNRKIEESDSFPVYPTWLQPYQQYYFDIFVTILGSMLCILATTVVSSDALKKIAVGSSCVS